MKTDKWLILLAVTIPSLMIEMAGTSVFVAFATITSDLNVSIDRSVWITTSYLAANAMMIPLAGWMGKKIGYKRVIISGIAVFTISALLGGLARDFDSLVLFSALQGLGDGPVMPVATALLLETFPPNQRGKMMVGIMLATGIAPALGPMTASWILEEIGWRGIYFMNVILGLISLAAITTILPSTKPSSENVKVNWLVFILLAIGTVSLQLFLDRGRHYDWFDSQLIAGFFIIAVSSLVLFLAVTFVKKDGSVLDFRILKNISFLTGNIANMLLMGLLYGTIMVKIFYLQWLMGFTPIYAGYYQAVLGGSMTIFSAIAGVLTDKVNPRWPVIFGLPVCFCALLMASRLSLYSDMESILTIGVLLGAGLSFVVVPISVTVFASINRKDMGAASVLNSYLMVISGSVSLALVTNFLMHRIEVNSVYLAGIVTADNPALAQAAYATNLDVALQAAYGHMMRQSAMFAFNDVWYLLAYVFILLIMYLPFMKKAKIE
jgi:DHA2 family multidrug resistance protein